MKRAPYLLALGFVGITIIRVSRFASDGSFTWNIIGMLFAIMLAMSVFVSSYFTGYAKTRSAAIISLIAFVLIDGYFNFAETLVWSVQSGRWDFSVDFGWTQFHVYRLADIVYGLFPTLAAALLGHLARYTSTIPAGKKRTLTGIFTDFLEGKLDVPERSGTVPVAKPNVPEQAGTLPEWMPLMPESKRHFAELVRNGSVLLPEGLSASELSRHIPVGERAARNWLREARNGHR